MKYDVTFSCGHTNTIQLYGKSSERDNKIAYYEKSGICTECYKAKKTAERTVETERASELASTLPELIGSEKQVAWAMTIRQKFLDDVNAKNPTEAGLKLIDGVIANTTSAKEWIDTRDDAPIIRIKKYAGK